MSSSNNISEQICTAIDIIVSKAVSEAQYDRTIQATVVSCESELTGKYKVKYQDSTFYAYAATTAEEYKDGDKVYVLVPGNDFSQTKTILGTVSHLGTDYVPLTVGDTAYDIIGKNCIDDDETEHGLCSYKWKDSSGNAVTNTVVLWAAENDESDNLLSIDTESLAIYLQSSEQMLCGATVRTDLPIEQQEVGNYGIIFSMTFADNTTGEDVEREYVIDVDNMSGNPYKLITATRQYGIYDIDSANFKQLNYVAIFNTGFSNLELQGTIGLVDDIFISSFELYGVEALSNEDLNSYSLTIDATGGTIFYSTTSSLTLEAKIRYQGSYISFDDSEITVYWFIEDSRVSTTSEYYNSYGGIGWKCLNSYEPATEDSAKQWYSLTKYLTIKKDDVQAKETIYKCVVIYNGEALSKTKTIIKNDGVVLSIESDSGNIFYYDNGSPTLTCLIDGKDLYNNQNNSNNYYTFSWSQTSNTGVYTALEETTSDNEDYDELVAKYNNLVTSINNGEISEAVAADTLNDLADQIAVYDLIQRIDENKVIHVSIAAITTYATFKCAVVQVKNGTEYYIGTATITLTNSLTGTGNCILTITNGTQIYKYNEHGIAPNNDSVENPISIQALGISLWDDAGLQVSDEVISHCEIRWIVPADDTLIDVDDYLDGYTVERDEELEAEYGDTYPVYVFKNLTQLVYNIATKYNIKYTRNDITLQVTYQGLTLTAVTNLTFTKDGEDGTNGTDFVCQIVPYVTSLDYDNSMYPTMDLIWNSASGSSTTVYYDPISGHNFTINSAGRCYYTAATTDSNGNIVTSTVYITYPIVEDIYDDSGKTTGETEVVNYQVRYSYSLYKFYFVDGDSNTNYLDELGVTYTLSYTNYLAKTNWSYYYENQKGSNGTDANIWFKARLWSEGELIFEGNEGISKTGDLLSDIKVEWSVLRNSYSCYDSNLSYVKDYSNITCLNSSKGYFFPTALTADALSFLSSDSTTAADYTGSFGMHGADIIKVQITYNGSTYYATLPIITNYKTLSYQNYSLELLKPSGFRYAEYTSDGQNPAYDSNDPFEIIVYDNSTGDKIDIRDTTVLTYTWSVGGKYWNSDSTKSSRNLSNWQDSNHPLYAKSSVDNLEEYQRYYKPPNLYDGLVVSNCINCTVKYNSNTIGILHIPVHMYLNRYGLASLNSWDGNSITINENEGYILAPQVGAGVKEDDNSFTGVLIGSVLESTGDETEVGLFGYAKGVRSIFLDAYTGSASFGTAGNGQIVIDPSADSALIYSGLWSTSGGKQGMCLDLSSPTLYIYGVEENANEYLVEVKDIYGDQVLTIDRAGRLTIDSPSTTITATALGDIFDSWINYLEYSLFYETNDGEVWDVTNKVDNKTVDYYMIGKSIYYIYDDGTIETEPYTTEHPWKTEDNIIYAEWLSDITSNNVNALGDDLNSSVLYLQLAQTTESGSGSLVQNVYIPQAGTFKFYIKMGVGARNSGYEIDPIPLTVTLTQTGLSDNQTAAEVTILDGYDTSNPIVYPFTVDDDGVYNWDSLQEYETEKFDIDTIGYYDLRVNYDLSGLEVVEGEDIVSYDGLKVYDDQNGTTIARTLYTTSGKTGDSFGNFSLYTVADDDTFYTENFNISGASMYGMDSYYVKNSTTLAFKFSKAHILSKDITRTITIDTDDNYEFSFTITVLDGTLACDMPVWITNDTQTNNKTNGYVILDSTSSNVNSDKTIYTIPKGSTTGDSFTFSTVNECVFSSATSILGIHFLYNRIIDNPTLSLSWSYNPESTTGSMYMFSTSFTSEEGADYLKYLFYNGKSNSLNLLNVSETQNNNTTNSSITLNNYSIGFDNAFFTNYTNISISNGILTIQPYPSNSATQPYAANLDTLGSLYFNIYIPSTKIGGNTSSSYYKLRVKQYVDNATNITNKFYGYIGSKKLTFNRMTEDDDTVVDAAGVTSLNEDYVYYQSDDIVLTSNQSYKVELFYDLYNGTFNYNYINSVHLSDIEVIEVIRDIDLYISAIKLEGNTDGYISSYISSLTVQADLIEMAVSKMTDGSYTTTTLSINSEMVQIAWNTVNHVIQFKAEDPDSYDDTVGLFIQDSTDDDANTLVKLTSEGLTVYGGSIQVFSGYQELPIYSIFLVSGSSSTTLFNGEIDILCGSNGGTGTIPDEDNGYFYRRRLVIDKNGFTIKYLTNSPGTSNIAQFYDEDDPLDPREVGDWISTLSLTEEYILWGESGNLFIQASGYESGATERQFRISTGTSTVYIDTLTSNTSSSYITLNPGGGNGKLNLNGNISYGSDSRLKNTINSVDSLLAYNIISTLNPVSFYYNVDEKYENLQLGFIAQDVISILENNDCESNLALVVQDNEGYYRLSYTQFIPLLVGAIQYQSQQIEQLQAQIQEIKGEN